MMGQIKFELDFHKIKSMIVLGLDDFDDTWIKKAMISQIRVKCCVLH